MSGPPQRSIPSVLLHAAFVLSGLTALLYQILWQRALFGIFGSNSESVAVVVAAFMIGLGFGSLAGGWISTAVPDSLPRLFAAAEFVIGLYGWFSLDLFHVAGGLLPGAGTWLSGIMAFALVLLPTLLMGATLPLLVAHRVRETGEVGRSVSGLYFVNTLGAAAGAAAPGFWLLPVLGMAGSIKVAVACNLLVGALVLLGSMGKARRGGVLA